MSIAGHDRPGLDLLGNVLFLLAIVMIVCFGVFLLGGSGYPLAAASGVYAGIVGASSFLRGYRAAREVPRPARSVSSRAPVALAVAIVAVLLLLGVVAAL